MPRAICLVADGFGIGALPDASKYGDEGADTLGHIAEVVGGLRLPVLEKLGLGNLGAFKGIAPQKNPLATITRLAEKSEGKDTTTGHWELAGLVTSTPFPLFPQGFPIDLLERWVKECGLTGFLGNYPASGTQIIEDLGEEHLRTEKPIVYTSGDSVFQVAAHEESFGLERLYQVCEIARKLTLPLQVGRVIARPFTGKRKGEFKRTSHRRDYAINPGRNALDVLSESGITVCSVGKIDDIFNHRSIHHKNHTGNNADSYAATSDFLKRFPNEKIFVFANLVDFDMLYGHRRDPKGYANALVEMDQFLGKFLAELKVGDTLFITADHGCDPTFKGTDHTREYVPLITYSPSKKGGRISDQGSFSHFSSELFKVFGK